MRTFFFLISAFVLYSYGNNSVLSEQNLETTYDSPQNIQICEEISRKILTSSPRYVQLTKEISSKINRNRGNYLGPETESNPFENNKKAHALSGAYYFTLYEMHHDWQVTIARFVFIFKKAELFEIDLATSKLKETAFDKSLLEGYPCSK